MPEVHCRNAYRSAIDCVDPGATKSGCSVESKLPRGAHVAPTPRCSWHGPCVASRMKDGEAILVVDDDADSRDSLKMLLEMAC